MKFRHIRTAKHGAVTLAYECVDGKCYYGAAFCSPRDMFSRAKGRLIARNRLMKCITGQRSLGMMFCKSGRNPFDILFDLAKYTWDADDPEEGPRWYAKFLAEVEKDARRQLLKAIYYVAEGVLDFKAGIVEEDGLAARFQLNDMQFHLSLWDGFLVRKGSRDVLIYHGDYSRQVSMALWKIVQDLPGVAVFRFAIQKIQEEEEKAGRRWSFPEPEITIPEEAHDG